MTCTVSSPFMCRVVSCQPYLYVDACEKRFIMEVEVRVA
jgi:hypothetical protein